MVANSATRQIPWENTPSVGAGSVLCRVHGQWEVWRQPVAQRRSRAARVGSNGLGIGGHLAPATTTCGGYLSEVDIPLGLYSPPQFNWRLPKKEPRPRQVKSMTIAAGFRCHDGVVLCTDSEHTSGQSKSYDHKIFEATAGNALIYVAGAGDDVYIRTAAQDLADRKSVV